MSANVSNTDFVPLPLINGHLTKGEIPSCRHGPALMFERFDKSHKAVRKFFACSAFRDRKACDFFKWADGPLKSSKSDVVKTEKSTHKYARQRFRTFKKLPRENRHVCCSCGLLLLPGEVEHHESEGHVLKKCIGLSSLRRVSLLFMPLENNKTFAQYLFSESTVNFLIEALKELSYTHVLCVGVPRIHEEIQCRKKDGSTNLRSFLLDLDDRYAQVYPPNCFSKYNMFNNHFFEAEGEVSACNFLASGGKNVILITDPPFGGMVEPLAKSFIELSLLQEKSDKGSDSKNSEGTELKECKLPLIWFFPYFMESRIFECLSNMSMLDYKVEYDNHNLYKNNVKKKGSPVRMFTNLSPTLLKLPADEGYWFCDVCQRYCSSENWHCSDCGSCTSKDGSRYVHCDMCRRCVKPSRVHCFKCESCQVQDHTCGQVFSEGCYICGELDHKRRDCPKKSSAQSAEPTMKKKRNLKRVSKAPGGKAKKKPRIR